jgi:hypothetical protein
MVGCHKRTLAALSALTAIAVLIPFSTAGAVQSTVMHLTPVAPQPGSVTKALNLTPHDVHLIEAGLAIVVLLAFALALRIRRRRRAHSAAVPTTEARVFPTTDEAWRGSGLVEEPTGKLPAFHASEVVMPMAAPGWHPIEGDRSKLRYWDGTRWTAQLEWDGQKWAEPAHTISA